MGCKEKPIESPKIFPLTNTEISYPAAFFQLVDTTCYTGFQILEIEEQLGFKAETAEYAFINQLLEDLEGKFHLKKSYTKKEATRILRIIHEHIVPYNQDLLSYHSSFSMCLRYKIFDCDIISILYLTIADHFDLPLSVVYMPNHLFIQWDDGKNKLYWETTEGRIRSPKHYWDLLKLEESQVGKGLLFEGLNRRQLTALVHYNVALAYANKGYYSKALPLLYQAIDLEPDWLEPYRLLGKLYQSDKLYNQAEVAFLKALEVVPKMDLVERELVDLYRLIGCEEEAENFSDR